MPQSSQPLPTSIMNEDTDRHAAIRLKYLSPTWVRYVDELAGLALEKNGGHFKLEVEFVSLRVRHFDWLLRFLPQNWRGKL